jgi:hypothetical protein
MMRGENKKDHRPAPAPSPSPSRSPPLIRRHHRSVATRQARREMIGNKSVISPNGEVKVQQVSYDGVTCKLGTVEGLVLLCGPCRAKEAFG